MQSLKLMTMFVDRVDTLPRRCIHCAVCAHGSWESLGWCLQQALCACKPPSLVHPGRAFVHVGAQNPLHSLRLQPKHRPCAGKGVCLRGRTKKPCKCPGIDCRGGRHYAEAGEGERGLD